MSLTPGTRLGPYEVTALIGEGGMGQVYRAHDHTLDRDVALKTLPDAFTSDPDRLARFEREAKTLATLNHPHIAQIHGLEESSGVRALVMELVEGDDLAQRIAGGPIPLDEALPIARQIAEALEAAHELGIVHRDLKPANIKVRADGTVKVLDFGLAKATEPLASSPGATQSPTITSPAQTMRGVILGTAAYMSPEQARGKPVDKRTDIWAFGCVLYEMLTGRRAFAGDDVPELLVAVLSRDVDLQALPAGTPPRIRRLVARCLDRDSRMRLRDIGEARVAIDAPPDTPAPAGVGWQQRAAIPAIGIAAAAIAMAAFSWMRPPLAPVDADTVSVDAVLEPNADVRVLSNQGFALSPEGDRLAFVGVDADERIAIWIQPLDGQAATLVPGSTNGVWPFWSPDGRTLGFSSGGQMLSIELASGATRTLCPTNAPDPKAAWASTGVILFQHDDAIYRTDALGSECRPVLSDELASGRQTAPAAFPDGRRFVFQDSRLDFHVVDLATGAQRRWIEHAFDVRIVAPHWAIYASSPVGNDVPTPRLLVQRFDPETLDLLGTPAVLLPAVVAPGGNASFSVAANGALVSVRNYADEGDLVWIDSSGQVVDTVPVAHDTWTYAVSHGGRRIALGGFGLWLRDLERGVDNRLPVEDRPPEITLSPAWSRDDARVAYASTFPGTPRLRAYRLQDGQVTTLFESPGRLLDGLAWSPDATALAFWRLAGRDAPVPEVWLHSPSSGETRRLFASAANFIYFSGRCSYCLGFSSAGRGLVYWSTDTGAPEVYLRPYPGAGPARQVSSRGGYDAHWSADGHTIYYVAPSGAIMSVAVGAAPDYRLGTPVAVVNRSPGSSLFAVSSDGTRFLRRQSSSVAPLRVTTNWQARAMRAMASPGAPPR